MSDFRYALRTLLRTPGFTTIAVVTLALGIGANSAIFSVVNGVLLRPLAFPEPDRLVQVWTSTSDERDSGHAAADFRDIQRENQALAGIAGYRTTPVTVVTPAGEPRALEGAIATVDFFDVLGVTAMHGRTFSRHADEVPVERYAVLSAETARQIFGAAERAVGARLRIEAETHTVLGVLPDRAEWPVTARVWTQAEKDVPPSPVDASGEDVDREVRYFSAIARLRSGVTFEQAEQDMNRLAALLQERRAATSQPRRLEIGVLHEQLVGDVRLALIVIQGAVGLVLLIACANVSSLLIARATGRRRELAVRAALGAGRRRLMRQLLSESLLLGAAGGLAGLLLGGWLIVLLVELMPPGVPRVREITMDRVVAAVTLITALATGVLFGVMPALQASRTDAGAALKQAGERGSSGRARARAILVVAEVALTLVLLAAAGLLLNSFLRLQNVDSGLRTENVTVCAFMLPQARYATTAERIAFYTRLLDALSTRGELQVAALGFPGPLRGSSAAGAFSIEGYTPPNPADRPFANIGAVSGSYFAAIGIPVLAGRTFDASDIREGASTAIVSQALAAKYWPGQDVVGRRLRFDDGAPWTTVVGMVGDVRQLGLDKDAPPIIYFPYQQFTLPFTNLFVRSAAPEGVVRSAVRAQLSSIDSELPMDDFRTMQEIVDRSVAQPRFRMLLISTFAVVALVLAAVGVFGLISYSVSQRTREIGIRIALGAGGRQVLVPMLRDGLMLTGAGVAAGLVGAGAATRLLSSFLFGVSAADPLTFAGVSALLLVVALLATYLPARRALRVDPVSALRAE